MNNGQEEFVVTPDDECSIVYETPSPHSESEQHHAESNAPDHPPHFLKVNGLEALGEALGMTNPEQDGKGKKEG
jgi:hypothetical protein